MSIKRESEAATGKVNAHTIAAVLCLFLAPIICSATTSGDESSSQAKIAAAIKRIDSESRKELGTGIVGLSLLLRSGPRVFVREKSLSADENKAMSELQISGYAKVNSVESRDGRYLELVPTEKGMAIIDAVGHRGPTMKSKD